MPYPAAGSSFEICCEEIPSQNSTVAASHPRANWRSRRLARLNATRLQIGREFGAKLRMGLLLCMALMLPLMGVSQGTGTVIQVAAL